MKEENTIHDKIKELLIQHYKQSGVLVTYVRVEWNCNLAGDVLRVKVSLDSEK